MKLKLPLFLIAIVFNLLGTNAFCQSISGMAQQDQVPTRGISNQGQKLQFNKKCNRSSWSEPARETDRSSIRHAASTGANGEIRVPSGDAFDYLYSYYMIDAWGESYIAGRHVNLYYDDTDDTVYLEKFLDEYMGDCYYVGGRLIEGDLENGVMEFDTRKAVYYSWGEWLMLIIANYDEATGSFYVNEEETTFRLNVEDGVISNYSTLLALASINDDTDVYWLQTDICYDPIDMEEAKVAEIPATATLSHYYQTVNASDESIANIYRDGNDFYFNNVFGEGLTFKGVMKPGNRIAVDLPQLVTTDTEFVYVNTFYKVGDTSYRAGDGETIYFEYDPATGDIVYSGSEAAITLFSGNKFLYLSYQEPFLTLDWVKFTESEEPIIVPSTATAELYAMSTGYDEQGNHKGGLMKIARDGNTVYFMRVDNTNYDVVMKGEMDPETNKVTVPLSQIVGISGSTFLGLSLAKQSIVVVEDYYDDDYNEIRYVVDSSAPSAITIDYDPETGIYRCHDVLAVTDAKRQSVKISLIEPTYSPVDEVAEVPSDAETGKYVFSKDGNVSSSVVVSVSRKGDDFYFVHPAPTSQVGEMTIHGVLNADGKIEIPVPQLVARGSKDQGAFLRVGTSGRNSTPEDADVQMRFWKVFEDDDIDAIYFDFDEGLNEIGYEGYFSVVQFSDNAELIKATTPVYKTYLVGAYEPAAPTDLALIDKSEDFWGNGQRYRLDFVIPCQDIEGKYLPYDNLSYRIYFDDEVFVFTPDEYPMTFTEEVTDVPFNHPASSEIPHPIWNSNMRQVYFYNLPQEKIGVQSCYSYEGTSKRSAISYIDVDASGIELISTDEVVKVEYFDICGRRCSDCQSGLVIVKKTYSDGRVISEKRFID